MDRTATEEQLATELSMLVRLVKAAVTREAAPGAGPDRSALLLLFPLMHAPQRPGALAGLSHADPSTISRQVAELVRRELVRREPDPSDGRASLLAITDAGREVCARVRTLRRELLAAAVAAWTDSELDTFAGLLSRFNGALGAAYCPPPARPAPTRPDPTRTTSTRTAATRLSPPRTLTTIAAGPPAGTEQEPA
jgi:DNA-binding MarR family transcriptional regulator